MGTDGVKILKESFETGEEFLEKYTVEKANSTLNQVLDIKWVLDRSNITTRDINLAFGYKYAIAYIAQYLNDYAIYLKRKPDDKMLYSISSTLYHKGGGLYLIEWALFFLKIRLLMYDGPIVAGKDTYTHDNIEGKQMLRYLALYMNERQNVVERMHDTIDASYKQNAVPMPDRVKKLIAGLTQKAEECRRS